MECRVVLPHRHQQRVYRAAILQVAHHVDVQILQCPLCLVDGIEVEHRLWWVQVRTVTRIDDGHVRHFTRVQRCTFQLMTHHNHVGIVAHHLDCVLQCLALWRTCHLGIGKTNHPCTQTVCCRLERKPRSRARFEEQRSHHLALQQLAVRMRLKLSRHVEQILNLLLSIVGNRNNAPIFHISVIIEFFFIPVLFSPTKIVQRYEKFH